MLGPWQNEKGRKAHQHPCFLAAGKWRTVFCHTLPTMTNWTSETGLAYPFLTYTVSTWYFAMVMRRVTNIVCEFAFCHFAQGPYLSVTYILWVLPLGFSILFHWHCFYFLKPQWASFLISFFVCRRNTEEPFYKAKNKVLKVSKYSRLPIYKFNSIFAWHMGWGRLW